MKPEPFALAGDQSQPIVQSVETLLRTDQRLEELTHGEIDAASDEQGLTVLLRHSQKHLLQSEAARQAAILNALPARVALLDKQGFIVSVNLSCQRFADANAKQNSAEKECTGRGVNYLAICDAAKADEAPEAFAVSAGIRAVLAAI